MPSPPVRVTTVTAAAGAPGSVFPRVGMAVITVRGGSDVDHSSPPGPIPTCSKSISPPRRPAPRSGHIAADVDLRRRNVAYGEEIERERFFTLGRDAMTIGGADGSLIDANLAMEQITGFSRSELLARPWVALIHPEDVGATVAAVGALARGHPMVGMDVRIMCKDGSHRTLSWSVTASPATGTLYAVGRDITEYKRLERALRESNAELVRADNAKSQFLSRMSHELRTPMNAILGFSQLLAMDMDGAHADYLRRIQRAGAHLLGLINDVLDISRVEAGAMQMSIEPVPIAGVVEEVAEMIRPVAAARGIMVTTRLDDVAGAHVLADVQRLTQVLLNLASNAVKYNREQGSLSMTAELRAGRVLLAVADTGPGIPTADLDRLFQSFDRLGAQANGIEGTGLGLALSRQLVDAMDGTIVVVSSEQGTTFTVDLLEAPPAASPVAAQGGLSPATTGSPVVLYVEENLANLHLVKNILEKRLVGAVTILPVMQGRLALELARQHRPDLILLDIHLPDLTGLDLLVSLRAEARTMAIPVVMIGAEATGGEGRRALEAGAHAYLTQPLHIDRFVAVVEELLGGSVPTV
jgi:PAS domain S-box-containing protein